MALRMNDPSRSPSEHLLQVFLQKVVAHAVWQHQTKRWQREGLRTSMQFPPPLLPPPPPPPPLLPPPPELSSPMVACQSIQALMKETEETILPTTHPNNPQVIVDIHTVIHALQVPVWSPRLLIMVFRRIWARRTSLHGQIIEGINQSTSLGVINLICYASCDIFCCA